MTPPRYFRHEDGLAATANLLALSIAANQPFYPATLYLASGQFLPASLWTFLSTPAFLAVPAAIRRSSRFGRALLVAAGIANTLLCLWLYGEASGVGLFLLPCALIAALLFRPEEWRLQMPLLGLALTAFIGLHQWAPGRTAAVPPDVYDALWSVHAASAALLTAFIGLLFSRRAG